MSMEAAGIAQHCKSLRLASIGTQFASLAEEASRQNHSHLISDNQNSRSATRKIPDADN